MGGFSQIPAGWQCVIVFLVALVVGYAAVAAYAKLMEGRKWCIAMAQGCRTAGLKDLGDFFTELGTGDIVNAEKQALKWAADMNDPEKRMVLLAEAIEDGVQYVAANDATVAAKLVSILQAGPSSKGLFAAPPAKPAPA